MGGRGGGQLATWLPQLAERWQSCNEFSIHWGVFDKSAKKIETQTRLNQKFHRIPSQSVSASLLLGRWPHRLAASKLIKSVKPNLIHCWGTENLNGSALLQFKGPSILSMQGCISAYLKTGDLIGWQWRFFRIYEPISIRKASIVTSESDWGLNRVADISPDKETAKIEYGVHPSFYQIPWAPIFDSPRFLFVGSLSRIKGVDILIEMLRRYPQRSWKMVFVGDGYLMQSLKELNDPSIEILGALKTEQVQAEMSKSWALVVPSRADTSPNVVKEARVIGLPVIGSPNGGHAEYISNGRDGLIIESESSDAWFNAINLVSNRFQNCIEFGKHRHGYFREFFRPEKTAEEFLKKYRKMV